MINKILIKANEIGDAVRESEASKALADAKAAFEADTDAAAAFEEYNEKRGKIDAEELVQLEIALKSRPVVQEYLRAEAEYNELADSTVYAVKAAIFGVGAGCCGNSGCGCCNCG